MKSILITLARICGLTATLLLGQGALAQNYPDREITFINPFAPGGGTEPVTRQFVAQLAKILGTQVNVENKPGGSATIGVGQVVRSRPNGYTIGLAVNNTLLYQPLLNTGLAFKTPDDYQAIVKLAETPLLLYVRGDAPWKNFEQFMAEVRKNPGKVRAAVGSLRGTPDMVVQQLNRSGNVKIVSVPFTGGGGEAAVALLGGRVEAYVGTGVSGIGQVQAGKFRVLTVFRGSRHDMFPDIPSTAESGYDATLTSSYHVVAPNGIPKAVLDKLVNASLQVVRSEEFRKFALANDYVVDPKGPDAVKAELNAQAKMFAELVKYMDGK